jgi:Protein of unknown function (DUF3311)
MQDDGSGRGGSRLWYLLLLPPYLAMAWVASYNKAEPEWAGIPFFYWYQLLWILIASVLTAIVYFATKRNDG